MKKVGLVIAGIVVLVGGAAVYVFTLDGLKPILRKPPANIVDVIGNGDRGVTTTDSGLTLPEGMRIEVFAQNLGKARVMAFDGYGNMWVSQPDAGTVTQLEVKDGKVVRQNAVLRNLNKPHGLAIDSANGSVLYIAEEDKITKALLYAETSREKIVDLPKGGRHTTRTLGFSPEGELFVSIGSACDVCYEENPKHGSIQTVDLERKELVPFAGGLRNAVFFTWNPRDGKMWATEMGRDRLGDNLPPDEINIVELFGDYGWPICYGNNVHDNEFDKNQYIQDPCRDKKPVHIELQAHVAPLGLAFIPDSWPEDLRGDLLVAEHGSWNRSVPVGYKIVRHKLDAEGKYEGAEDFISGWLTGDNRALGRPVDVVFGPDNALYISDDKAGVIYRVTVTQ